MKLTAKLTPSKSWFSSSSNRYFCQQSQGDRWQENTHPFLTKMTKQNLHAARRRKTLTPSQMERSLQGFIKMVREYEGYRIMNHGWLVGFYCVLLVAVPSLHVLGLQMPWRGPRQIIPVSCGWWWWWWGRGLHSIRRMFLFLKKRPWPWYSVALGLYECVKRRTRDFDYQGLKRADLFEASLAPVEINKQIQIIK